MTKYKSPAGVTHSPKRKPVKLPEKPITGQVWKRDGGFMIFNGRDWAWAPNAIPTIAKVARRFGWGVRVTASPINELAGYTPEGDRIIRRHVKIVMTIGREPGEKYKGFQYRLVWDTVRTGIFEPLSFSRRTSDHPAWETIGTIGEIPTIIAQNPVTVPTIVASAEGSDDA